MVEIDPIRVGRRDMRRPPAVCRRDQRPVTAVRRQGNDVLVGPGRERTRGLAEDASRSLHGDEPIALGRPGRLLVDRGPRRQPNRRRAAVGAHLVNVSAVGRPGDEGDPGAVGRPGRLCFDYLEIGQAARLAVRQWTNPEPVESGGRQPRTVGRRHRIPDLPCRERGTVVHVVTERQLRTELQVCPDAERDRDRFGPLRRRHAPDPAAVRHDELRGIRSERHAGQNIAARHRLLIVAGYGIGEPPFVAGRQMAQPKPGRILVTGPVDQPFAIGRDRRTKRRTVARAPRVLLTRLPVVVGKLVLREYRVVLPEAGALRVPDAPAVRLGDRTGYAPRARLLDQLHAGTAVDVPHPEFGITRIASCRRMRCGGGDDVVSVWQPIGRLVAVRVRVGHLPRLPGCHVDQPEVLRPVAVGNEDDAPAVRAVAGLAVPRQAARQRRGVPSRERKRVQVAQQIEDNRLPIGTHIDRDPGSLIGVQ